MLKILTSEQNAMYESAIQISIRKVRDVDRIDTTMKTQSVLYFHPIGKEVSSKVRLKLLPRAQPKFNGIS